MTDIGASTESTWSPRPIDREMLVTRVVDAYRESVFRTWTEPKQVVRWLGPKGMTIETHEADTRTDGIWRFDMTPPMTHVTGIE